MNSIDVVQTVRGPALRTRPEAWPGMPIGARRPNGQQQGIVDPAAGEFSWLLVDQREPPVKFHLRLVYGSHKVALRQSFPEGRMVAKDGELGWLGRVIAGGNTWPYSVSQRASPNRDDFAIEYSFTSPLNISQLVVEYVFELAPFVYRIRNYQDTVEYQGFVTTDFRVVPMMPYPIGSDSSGQIELYGVSGESLGFFNFRHLLEMFGGGYFYIEQVLPYSGRMNLVVGFDHGAFRKNQVFAMRSGYFGLSSGDNTYNNAANILEGMRFQNTAGTGNITSIELLIDDATPNGSVRLGIYSDSSGSPGALLSDAGAATVADGWVTKGSLSIAVTADAYYWLAYDLEAANGVRYQTGGASGSHAWRTPVTYGALPDPFGTPTSTNTNQYVMRAYVDTGGAARRIFVFS